MMMQSLINSLHANFIPLICKLLWIKQSAKWINVNLNATGIAYKLPGNNIFSSLMRNMPFTSLNVTAYMPLSNFMGRKLAYPEASADRNCHSCRFTPRTSLFGVLDQCLQRPKGLTCRQGLLMISINTHSLLPLRASALASLPPTFVVGTSTSSCMQASHWEAAA